MLPDNIIHFLSRLSLSRSRTSKDPVSNDNDSTVDLLLDDLEYNTVIIPPDMSPLGLHEVLHNSSNTNATMEDCVYCTREKAAQRIKIKTKGMEDEEEDQDQQPEQEERPVKKRRTKLAENVVTSSSAQPRRTRTRVVNCITKIWTKKRTKSAHKYKLNDTSTGLEVTHYATNTSYTVPIAGKPSRPPSDSLPPCKFVIPTTQLEFQKTQIETEHVQQEAHANKLYCPQPKKTKRGGKHKQQHKEAREAGQGTGQTSNQEWMRNEQSRSWDNRKIYDAVECARNVNPNIDPLAYLNRTIKKDKLQSQVTDLIQDAPECITVTTPGYICIPTLNDPQSSQRWIRKSSVDPELESWKPEYLVVRTRDDYLDANTIRNLKASASNMVAGGGFEPPASHKGNCPRSSSMNGVPHVGIWGCYFSPRLTKDTTDQKDDGAKDNIMRTMLHMQRCLSPALVKLLRQIDPKVYQFRQLICHRILSELSSEAKTWPMDHGGAFFAWTIRKGSSDIIHCDPMDDPKGYAFVIPLGNFTGANLVFPTLGLEIPLKEGQVLAFNAHLLPHYATSVTEGERLVLTCFTDKTMAATSRDILLDAGVNVDQLAYN